MDKKEKKVVGYYLTPKLALRALQVMEALKAEGYPTDNRVLTLVLQVMHENGEVLKLDSQGIMETIKKTLPKGAKILYVPKRNEQDGDDRIAN